LNVKTPLSSIFKVQHFARPGIFFSDDSRFFYYAQILWSAVYDCRIVCVGWLRLPTGFSVGMADRFQRFAEQMGGVKGAFLFGIAFSLGFCPTMFLIFFGTLMPLTLTTSYGFLLPPVFGIGTVISTDVKHTPLILKYGGSDGNPKIRTS
jgi:hypothetical protein